MNGVYQLNAERVNEIAQAKAEEQIATNNANKANAQSKYLQNAAQIERYRRALEDMNFEQGETAESVKQAMEALQKENLSLRLDCDQYNLMNSVLAEATSAYQNWLTMKDSGQSGDMFDDSLSALKQINDVLNNTESDLFGRIGRSDYKAALDFILPDHIDREDTAAINSYLDSVRDMFTYDDSGNATGLNKDYFAQQALEQGLLVEDGDKYRIAGQKTMEDFAEGLNLSMPMVQAIFGEFEEFGAKFVWGTTDKTLGDLGVDAYEAADALRQVEGFSDLRINMDVSDFDSKENAVASIEDSLAALQDFKATPEIALDETKIGQVNDMIAYLVAQKQVIEQPAIMTVKTESITSEIGPMLSLLKQFQQAQNTMAINVAQGVDTSQAQSAINELVSSIQSSFQNLSPDIKAKIQLDPSSEATISDYIAGLDAQAIIDMGVDASLVEAYQSSDIEATGTVRWQDDKSRLTTVFSGVGYVTWYNKNTPTPSGGSGGTALASGTTGAEGGKALVGELGREIVVDPADGRWYTVGENGAEFVNVPKGAIIFNHRQADALLSTGHTASRGRAYAGGVLSGVLKGITNAFKKANSAVGGYIPKTTTPTTSVPKRTPGGYGGDSGRDNTPDESDLEAFDWIEIAIDRIERAINKLGKTASSVFKALQTRLTAAASEISKVAEEIELQQKAYDRYIQEAETVALSDELKALVRDGAIDISKYDKDTLELIDDYQEWYEKALDCADAIDDLHESLAQLYRDKFDAIQTNYSNRLSLMQKESDALEKRINALEAQGYMQNANYYAQLQEAERQNIGLLQKELADLTQALNEAVASGEIEEGSDAWYEMKLSIEETKAAIDDAELSIIQYGKTIQQIRWDYFDYAQERISKLADEADFLAELMDGKDMYEKNGGLSDAGSATMGLHGEKYGVYMSQAEAYAEEIKRINRELADDPANKDLLDRRDELIEAQRDSIFSAKKEKESMIELAKDGIQVELDALQELIDAYNDSLDSAKDLYEYQKKIAEKTTNIASLEKQLAAYRGDISEETRSKIQKLQVELKDAKDDLKDTEYDRFVSDAKEALSSLYSEYEELLNSQFDDTDAMFEKLIEYVNTNSADINETIAKEAENVGYTISEATTSLWANGGGATGVVSVYGSEIAMRLTSVGTTVENIFAVLSELAKANGVPFGNVKSYSTGGLVNYTGIANVHGSESRPEAVLNAEDTRNFIMLRDAMRSGALESMLGAVQLGSEITGTGGIDTHALKAAGNSGGYTVGEISISIPIEHVADYNDFVRQLRDDRQFEQMIQDVTIGRIAGKNSLSKNRHRW